MAARRVSACASGRSSTCTPLFEFVHDPRPNRLPGNSADPSGSQVPGPSLEFAGPRGGDVLVRFLQTDEQLFGYPDAILARQAENLGEQLVGRHGPKCTTGIRLEPPHTPGRAPGSLPTGCLNDHLAPRGGVTMVAALRLRIREVRRGRFGGRAARRRGFSALQDRYKPEGSDVDAYAASTSARGFFSANKEQCASQSASRVRILVRAQVGDREQGPSGRNPRFT